MGIIVLAIIAFGFVAGVLAVIDGSLSIPWWLVIGGLFVSGALTLIGGMFSRDYNRDRAINGEIETKLQRFTNLHEDLMWQARAGKDVSKRIAEVNRLEAEFRATIEYGVVTDGSENYYSYRG